MTSLHTFAAWRNDPICKSFEYLDTLLDGLNYVIAGGSVRKLFLHEPIEDSDIDVWFYDEESLTTAKNRLMDIMRPNIHHNVNLPWSKPFFNTFSLCSHSEFGYTLVYEDVIGLTTGTTVQLLRKQSTNNGIDGVIGVFDYTICQFGYSKGTIYATQAAMADHQAGILRLNEKYDPKVCYDRALKYIGKGYTPTRDLFDKLFLHDRQTLTHSSIDIENLNYTDIFKRV
jgi:hypothetical protein